jgi:ATP-binding cassette subfamily C protein
MLPSLRGLIALLPRRLALSWLSLTPLSLAEATLESLGAAAIFALISLLQGGSGAFSQGRLAPLFRDLAGKGFPLRFMLLVALLYLVKTSLVLLAAGLRARLSSRTVAALFALLAARYLHAPLLYHRRHNSAVLADRAMRGIEQTVILVLEAGVAALTEACVLAGLFLVLVALTPSAALAVLILLALLLSGLYALTHRAFHRLGRQHRDLRERLSRDLHQALGGIREVKAADGESHWLRLLAGHQEGVLRLRTRHAVLNTLPRFLVEMVFVSLPLGLLALLAAAGFSPAPDASMLPLLGLLAYTGFRTIPTFNRLAMNLNCLRFGAADLDLLLADVARLERESGASDPSAGPPATFAGEVALEGVSFAYDAGQPLLREVTLRIARGESVALVGATGCGKSTLLEILLGLLPPSAGRVTADGQDIRGREASWRRLTGYVPQETWLLDDTLRRNIAFGHGDREISAERLQEAVRLAQLEDLVARLPRGLETEVGERGHLLSGGERQRVAIARALYRRPELLLFDEATSALDGRTEQELSRALESVARGMTVVMAAHRPETVRSCRRIVVLRGGGILAQGSWGELMAGCPEFRELMAAEPPRVSGG